MTLSGNVISKYSNKTENEKPVSKARFRDYGLLKFGFAALKNLPLGYVRSILYLWTKPELLDENHPKINLVDHKNFIPEQLPSYNP